MKASFDRIDRTTRLEDLPEFLSVDEAARWLGVSRWLIFEGAKRGEIRAAHIGRRVLIPRRTLAALAGVDQS
jgi:excisionase family DNA binding protein